MADYTLTAGYAATGNGTNITPERWITALQDALPVYSTWSQFLTTVVGGERLLEAGKGDTIRVNYFDNVNVPTAALVEGTYIARGTQANSQVSLTVYEEGNKLDISGFQSWLCESPLVTHAAQSLAKNMVQRREYILGELAVAATSYFSIYGTDAEQVYENAHTGPMCPSFRRRIECNRSNSGKAAA